MRGQAPKRTGIASAFHNRRLQWFAIGVYGLLLMLGSLLPGSKIPEFPDWSTLFSPDKVAHFGAYALFALLLSVPYSERGVKGLLLAVILATLYGVLLEFLQAVIGTGRSFDPVDMVANLLGALLGGLLFFLAQQLINGLFASAKANE